MLKKKFNKLNKFLLKISNLPNYKILKRSNFNFHTQLKDKNIFIKKIIIRN